MAGKKALEFQKSKKWKNGSFFNPKSLEVKN